MDRVTALAFDPRAEFRRLMSRAGTMDEEEAERAVREFQRKVDEHLTNVVYAMEDLAQTPEDEEMLREAWEDREETRALQESWQ